MPEVVCVEWDELYFISFLDDGTVIKAEFSTQQHPENIGSDVAERLKRELEKYFSRKAAKFDFEVVYPANSERILREVRKIPYGKTITYGELAKKLNTSPRAVGAALRANRVPVIVPCHRVIGKGWLGGYSGGLEIKMKLLKLEGVSQILPD
jgi:methylated-DNA-[protein]-cysteine S-methyltransferase